MTRRLRTVTKIFKNMYLSGRTAVQFQFQFPDPAGPRVLLPSSLRLAIFISRFLPAAAPAPPPAAARRGAPLPSLFYTVGSTVGSPSCLSLFFCPALLHRPSRCLRETHALKNAWGMFILRKIAHVNFTMIIIDCIIVINLLEIKVTFSFFPDHTIYSLCYRKIIQAGDSDL